jgi:hypothetical protein
MEVVQLAKLHKYRSIAPLYREEYVPYAKVEGCFEVQYQRLFATEDASHIDWGYLYFILIATVDTKTQL